MQPTDRLTIPACIGCGAMRHDQTCLVACAERRAELVNAGDYDRLTASAAACRARVRGLRVVAAELASAQPAEGEWQAAYQAVQESARSALRRFTAPGGSPADPFPAAQTVVVWRCSDCGGVDAPQPCIGVCVWRAAQWVDAAAYEAERSRALGDRQAERSLAGLLRTLALTTPRPGQWERCWRALQVQAQQALTGAYADPPPRGAAGGDTQSAVTGCMACGTPSGSPRPGAARPAPDRGESSR